jgi:hypothetical protein
MLVHCLYASRLLAPLDPKVLDAIFVTSHRNNMENGITGILCFNETTFIQLLEGSRREVSSLFRNITQDDRHFDVELLLHEEIERRSFSSWTMGKVNLDKVNPAVLLRYSEKPKLDPFSSSGSAVLSLLTELVNTASISIRSS